MKPVDRKLTLKQIAEFYQEKFVGKVKRFDVRHKKTPFQIKFDESHLAHLLALHKFGYKRGEVLFQKLLSGEITFEVLRKRDQGAFKENRFRMEFFIYVNEVLEDPKIIIYDLKERRAK